MRPDIAEEALPFSEKETQGNGWRFPKRKTSEQSEHCSDVAEKEGFEPSRQSPQPTPLAGEPLTATWVLLRIYNFRWKSAVRSVAAEYDNAQRAFSYLAEREGFEPPVPCSITGFQDRLHKPLGHLSRCSLCIIAKHGGACQEAGTFVFTETLDQPAAFADYGADGAAVIRINQALQTLSRRKRARRRKGASHPTRWHAANRPRKNPPAPKYCCPALVAR